MNKKIHVYAVIRADEYISGDEGITVKAILPTMEEAIQEVERLNQLQQGKNCHYFWCIGRYFPQGRSNQPEGSSSDSD